MLKKIRFYTYPSCTSCRKTKAWLRENGVSYEERHLFRNPPSVDELKDIVKMTHNGMDDILSTRSKTFKELDVDIDDMKFSELLEILSEEPRLLRRPILFDGEKLIIGYDREALTNLLA